MQARVGKFHVRLDTRDEGDLEPPRLGHHVLEQPGLSHPRCAPEGQHPALSAPHGVEQPVQQLALLVPPEDRHPCHESMRRSLRARATGRVV